jgi:hypothetical protein
MLLGVFIPVSIQLKGALREGRWNMAKAWHLSRGNKTHGPITHRELLLLAELGQVRGDDLLWRAGFYGWRTANSLPGLLTPPPLPNTASFIAATRTHLRKFNHWLIAQRQGEIGLLAKDWSRSIQLRVRDVHTHIRQADGIFPARMQNPQLLAALLLFVAGVFAFDVARHHSFATSTQAAPNDLGSPELRRAELSSTADPVVSLPSTDQPRLEESTIEQATDESVNAKDPSPPNEIVPVTDSVSEVPSISVSPEPSSAIPLPTKKPAKPVKPVTTAQAVRPKPMRFGTIGFNYLAQ